MLKKYFVVLFTATLFAQPIFAHDMGANEKPCMPIVKACLDAGFGSRANDAKLFWQDCMEPLLLGKTVEKVSVSATDVKTCRTAKIKELKEELSKLEKVQ